MSDAYWRGYNDYNSGFMDNPYPVLSQEWYDWDAGQEDAELENEG